MKTPPFFSLVSGLLLLSALSASASDWPQFRGPQRSGITTESAWASDWTTNVPKTLWVADAGESYASTLIVNGSVYLTGSNPQKDTILCLNAETGKERWKVSFDHASRKQMAIADPRSNALTATPLWHENRLYFITREGDLFCLDAKKGDTLWQTNLLRVCTEIR